ncbi:MAG: maleylacetoacetate isomerase [Myxococcales bacterium]|nr:maleylacetoacetate isomerase [Myxococcales bacterium]
MSDAPIYRLHSYFRSSCSWRVRAALAFKGLDYITVPVHLVQGGGQQLTPAYLAKNPMGQVPLLETADGLVAQSVAILEYLEERHPAPSLYPGSAFTRAQIRQVVEVVNSGIQPLQNLWVLRAIEHDMNQGAAGARAFAARVIERGFKALETVLGGTAGRYAVGDAPSAADLFLVPQVQNARRFGVPLDGFPIIARVDREASELEALKAAHPDRQPDAE